MSGLLEKALRVLACQYAAAVMVAMVVVVMVVVAVNVLWGAGS